MARQRLELIIGLEINCDLWIPHGEKNLKALEKATVRFAQQKIAELQGSNDPKSGVKNCFVVSEYGEQL